MPPCLTPLYSASGCDTSLGHLVHPLRTYLHLYPLTSGVNHSVWSDSYPLDLGIDIQSLITVGIGSIENRLSPSYTAPLCCFSSSRGAVYHYADRKYIVNLLERDAASCASCFHIENIDFVRLFTWYVIPSSRSRFSTGSRKTAISFHARQPSPPACRDMTINRPVRGSSARYPPTRFLWNKGPVCGLSGR